MLKSLKNREKGQTLIEALITLLFIAVSVIALIRFQSYLAYNNILAEQRNEASILAIQKIEKLRDFQVLNNTSGYTSYQSIASGSSTTNSTTTTYTTTWTVTPSTNPTYKNLDVKVSWTDRNNNSNTVELTTIIAGIDPQNSSTIM